MAHHADALKRIRQNKKRNARNRHFRASMRTEIKRVRTAIDAGDLAAAEASLPSAVSVIQKLATKNIIHKRNASRRVARLAAAVNKLKSAAS
ncbi:MAG: 30S ribosomal protein S20 [Proteobacteria bacterium]|nr:30S ribosomal protein S20 [Pseudomonadota bacterium]MCP4920174.1 30S ribosomal protein S20 [Pseudomonadota bacterium]